MTEAFIDPGLTRCGLGVVDGRAGRRVTLVAVDVVRTPRDADLATRDCFSTHRSRFNHGRLCLSRQKIQRFRRGLYLR